MPVTKEKPSIEEQIEELENQIAEITTKMSKDIEQNDFSNMDKLNEAKWKLEEELEKLYISL